MPHLRLALRDLALAVTVVSLPIASVHAQGLPSSAASAPRAALGGAAPAPTPNAWTEVALPLDYAGPSTIKCLGTCVVMRTPSSVHLWSAITGTWTVVPASPGATISQFNAFVVVEDGTTLHAWATRTGLLETLHFSTPPNVFLGPLSSCWLVLAFDGNQGWAFSAFDGVWRPQTLASNSPAVDLTQTVAMVDDGSNVYGISAYWGDWVATPSLAGGTGGVNGEVAAVWTGSQARGFSAHTDTWDSHAFSSAVLLAHERGYVMWQDGNELVAFGACTGDFAVRSVPPGSTWEPGRYVAASVSGAQVTAYSSGQNTFVTQAFTGTPSVVPDDEVLVVKDAAGVTAFSVVTGAFSAKVPAPGGVTVNDAVVWALGAGHGLAYSPVLGSWSASPALAPGSVVTVQRNVVVVADASGYHGFSGRTGTWSSRATQTAFDYMAPTSSDLFAAFDGPRAIVFDPILSRWMDRATSGPLLTSDLWRQTFVGADAKRAHGYGLMNNAWSSIPLVGVVQGLDANSSAGFVVTDSRLYTYSAHGSLSTLSRFPEFSRLQPVGVPLRLLQTAPAGSIVLSVVGLEATWQPFSSLGTIYVAPSSVLGTVPLGVVPAGGLLDAALDLSGFAALQGHAVHVQNLVRPPGEDAYLSNLVAPVLL